MPRRLIHASLACAAIATLAACGGPAPSASTAGATGSGAAGVPVDPAALYCQGTGGTVIPATAGGRRADLCRMPDGRTVRAADLLNSHNDL